ncbi:MAG: hypothetical protein ACK56I_07185, partial [bacterium]
ALARHTGEPIRIHDHPQAAGVGRGDQAAIGGKGPAEIDQVGVAVEIGSAATGGVEGHLLAGPGIHIAILNAHKGHGPLGLGQGAQGGGGGQGRDLTAAAQPLPMAAHSGV